MAMQKITLEVARAFLETDSSRFHIQILSKGGVLPSMEHKWNELLEKYQVV